MKWELFPRYSRSAGISSKSDARATVESVRARAPPRSRRIKPRRPSTGPYLPPSRRWYSYVLHACWIRVLARARNATRLPVILVNCCAAKWPPQSATTTRPYSRATWSLASMTNGIKASNWGEFLCVVDTFHPRVTVLDGDYSKILDQDKLDYVCCSDVMTKESAIVGELSTSRENITHW